MGEIRLLIRLPAKVMDCSPRRLTQTAFGSAKLSRFGLCPARKLAHLAQIPVFPPFRRGYPAFIGAQKSFSGVEKSFLSGQKPFPSAQKPFLSGRKPFLSGQKSFLSGRKAFLSAQKCRLGGQWGGLGGQFSIVAEPLTRTRHENSLFRPKLPSGRPEPVFRRSAATDGGGEYPDHPHGFT